MCAGAEYDIFTTQAAQLRGTQPGLYGNQQQRAISMTSPHTIASYRDTFRLLLSFAERRLKRLPCELTIDDLDTPFLGAFLDHLEQERNNSARSRNVRRRSPSDG